MHCPNNQKEESGRNHIDGQHADNPYALLVHAGMKTVVPAMKIPVSHWDASIH